MRPRMPKGFGSAGQKLWKTVLDEYDLDNEPAKLEILAHTCCVTDTIAELDRATAGQPLTVRGSAGQMVIHPLIAEVRVQRALLAQLLARLNFAPAEED